MESCLVAVSLDNWTLENEGLLSLLSDREVKALRLHGSRQELTASLVGYTLAKALIRFRYRAEGEIKREKGGKPYLSSPDWEGEFSVSHSGNLIVCAATPSGRIGVDVERIRPVMNELIGECLSEQERKLWLAAPTEEERRALFFRLWTLKEAYLKFAGVGLGGAVLPELDFACAKLAENGALPHLPNDGDFPVLTRSGEEQEVSLSHFGLADGYSLAVCGNERFASVEWLAPPRLTPSKAPDVNRSFRRGSGFKKVPGLWSSFFS